MAKSEESQLKPQELQVSIPEKLRPGVYANITNINVTPNEVVFNFIYANPHDTPSGTLVSRVIVNKKHARQLNAILKEILATDAELNNTND